MRPPEYLTNKKELIRFLLVVAIFATIFILIYKPLGVVNHIAFFPNVSGVVYVLIVVGVGFVILFLSHLMLYKVLKKAHLRTVGYIFWLVAEILVFGVILSLLANYLTNSTLNYWDLFLRISVNIFSILIIPYVFSTLLFMLKEKERQLQYLVLTKKTKISLDIMPFNDKNGKFNISINPNDILYIESADNYVNIHHLDEGKEKTHLLRNSLKNVEEHCKNTEIIRCHRFYLVNMSKVKIVKRDQDRLYIAFYDSDKQIPVSKTYVNQIIKLFSKTTKD